MVSFGRNATDKPIFKYSEPIRFNMKNEFNIIIEEGEDGYFISEVVELPGCHTQAKTLDQLLERTKEAISLYLKCEKKIPREKFLGIQRLAV